MPFRVSRKIKSGLPKSLKDDVALEKALWNKTGGLCFLCESPIQRASEDYEADHDVPDADGGSSGLDNLNLAHAECNRIKRAHDSARIRPFLKFDRYLKSAGYGARYDQVLAFFEVVPKPSVMELVSSDEVRIEFASGEVVTAPVFTEQNDAGIFRFVYANVPASAIYNDAECQPRNIKREQVLRIYLDLWRNPLHEPPSLRLSKPIGSGTVRGELLMFDGQHKAVSNWLMGRESIVSKIYLDISREAAVELVNSIQAKIPKLNLTPFEFASKFTEEWRDRCDEYVRVTGDEDFSEAGFISWLPAADRKRATSALKASILQGVLEREDLRIKRLDPIVAKGRSKNSAAPWAILKETTIKTKVVEQLIYSKPTHETGKAGRELREFEVDAVVRLVNEFTDSAFGTNLDRQPTELEALRADRMKYQASLKFSCGLMRDLWGHVFAKSHGVDFALSDVPSPEQWSTISRGIERLVNHPVWVSAGDDAAGKRADALEKVKIAMEKNQNERAAFQGVGLDLAYLIVQDPMTNATYATIWGG